MNPVWKRAAGYSAEIKRRLFSAIRESAVRWAVWFLVIGALSTYFFRQILAGEGDVGITGMLLTTLLFSLLPAYGTWSSLILKEPSLLSYFSEHVPGCGLGRGRSLLRHSAQLDALALQASQRPLSTFLSDDDFFDKKELTWNSATEMLNLVNALLTTYSADECVLACRDDLTDLRERLEYASKNNIRFCFLLRTIDVTNGREWEQRKGFC